MFKNENGKNSQNGIFEIPLKEVNITEAASVW